jgi:phage gp36-like protein
MAYTTPANVREIMRKLPTSIKDSDIQFHIDKAEAYVNGYLGGVFNIPFDPVPKLIQNITTDLSIFFMAESFYSSNQPNLDEYQETRYERSIKMLEQIVSGDLVLIIDGEIQRPRDSDASGFATTNDQQIFNYEDPEW